MDNFDGNIFECIRKGEDFYASNINWRIDVTGKTQHTEIPEIPMIAVHEILINAFSTSCDYCEYFPICRHCKKEFRKILNMRNSEVIKKMEAEKSDK